MQSTFLFLCSCWLQGPFNHKQIIFICKTIKPGPKFEYILSCYNTTNGYNKEMGKAESYFRN